MAIFKVDAQGDTMYFRADTQAEAQRKLFDITGPIPESLLTWTEVTEADIPEGDEAL